MATTTQPYTGNNNRGKGTAPFSDLSFSFDYLKTEDVKVSLNGTQLATTKYSFPTANPIRQPGIEKVFDIEVNSTAISFDLSISKIDAGLSSSLK